MQQDCAQNAEPFLTQGVDIESHFLNAEYLAEINDVEEDLMDSLIDQATEACQQTSTKNFVNGRVDIERKKGTYGKLDLGKLASEAPDIIEKNPERFRHSKTVLKQLRHILTIAPELRSLTLQEHKATNLKNFIIKNELKM